MSSDTDEQLSDAQLEQRRAAGFQEQHGGAGAVKAIQEGKPFAGLAAQEEQRVIDDLASDGRAALVEENAVRLQTAARLYWGALQSAADAGDLEKLHGYVKTFGWLAGASLRAWDALRKEGKGDDSMVVDAMKAAKEAGNDER